MALSVKVSKAQLQQDIEDHPFFPSLLSIGDVLKSRGIDNVSARVPTKQLIDIDLPLIAQINIDETPYFSIIYSISGNSIEYLDPETNRKVVSTVDQFDSFFSGNILLGEVEETNRSNAGITTEKKDARNYQALFGMLLGAAIIFRIFFGTASSQDWSFAKLAYDLLYLLGTIIGSLLLWHETDKTNSLLKKICGFNDKTDCNSVLSSEQSKIFGISWAHIGFSYFAASFIALITIDAARSPEMLQILSWTNLLSLPYPVYSIYYQAKVAKKWCTLCLIVQGILVLQAITSWTANFPFLPTTAESLIITGSSYIILLLVVFLSINRLVPLILRNKRNRRYKGMLNNLKYDPAVFYAMLAQQKPLTPMSDKLGINIGKSNGKHQLVKVSNPYCSPCAMAHTQIEELLEEYDLQVKIIYPSHGDTHKNTQPIKHLLAIDSKKNEAETREALNDWFTEAKTDYEIFSSKYPMNGELEKQNDQLMEMGSWCKSAEIEGTPTIYLDGHLLPPQYDLSDLKYFLTPAADGA